MKIFKGVLSLCIWSALTTFCYASPLKVEISLNENSPLNPSIGKDTGSLVLSTRITNISDHDQQIPIWICSYGSSWVASTPKIVTGLESCKKNFIKSILLKPNESYSRDLVVAISSKAQAGSLTFEMGFNPDGDWSGTRRGIDQTIETLKGIIWSNALVISVTDDRRPFLLKISKDLDQKSIKDFHLHWAGHEYKKQTTPVEWRRCSIDADCGSIKVGCYYWMITNKSHFKKVGEKFGAFACERSINPGPKPAVACINQVCVDKWNVCAQDSDCVVSNINCPFAGGWKSVNGKYIQEFEDSQRAYVKEDLRQSCPGPSISEGAKPAAGCVDKACQLLW